MNEIPNRLTVVETVYHQSQGQAPKEFSSRFSRSLTTEEQPYERHLKVTEQWQRLDCGWIKDAGMLVIENVEGRNLQRIPSDEEKADIAKRVITVAYMTDAGPEAGRWLVPPGESMRAIPGDVSRLAVRCQHGTARFTLYLLPR